MYVKLPDFMRKWNFTRMMTLSVIVFCTGLFCGYISPQLLKAAFTSVSGIREPMSVNAYMGCWILFPEI